LEYGKLLLSLQYNLKPKAMKTVKLPFKKVFFPATYKQVNELLSYPNVTSTVSTSQILKRLDNEDAFELIDLAAKGEEIKILG